MAEVVSLLFMSDVLRYKSGCDVHLLKLKRNKCPSKTAVRLNGDFVYFKTNKQNLTGGCFAVARVFE